jgi:hypothetical protein
MGKYLNKKGDGVVKGVKYTVHQLHHQSEWHNKSGHTDSFRVHNTCTNPLQCWYRKININFWHSQKSEIWIVNYTCKYTLRHLSQCLAQIQNLIIISHPIADKQVIHCITRSHYCNYWCIYPTSREPIEMITGCAFQRE